MARRTGRRLSAAGPADLSPPSLLLRTARLVPVGPTGPRAAASLDRPVDLRLRGGVVVEVGRLEPTGDEEVLDAEGRWAVPGLWDAHVHLVQWAQVRTRLDVAGTTSARQATAVVAAHVAAQPPGSEQAVLGYGQRTATWPHPPTVSELDAVSGRHPVALVSGDAHSGWLNSRALQLLGLPPRSDPVTEAEWFAVLPRLDELGSTDPGAAVHAAVQEAAARGLVGVGDMEWERGHLAWPPRVAEGVDRLRVRTAVYADALDDVLAAGLRTGTPLAGGAGLVTQGPLKVIFDGSLNTRTAWCHDAYAGDDAWRGQLNLSPQQLTALCRRAHQGGLEVAVHAIGDAAVSAALDAVAASGARGSVEHVQLVHDADLPRFAALGVQASVQPAHLFDDRDVTAQLWPDRQGRCFALRSLLAAGAVLRLGSDAPVAPLDPWRAMAAAVHRSGDDRPPWHPEQSLTPAQALAASVDGRRTLGPGAPADLVLLDRDPLALEPDTVEAAARLRTMPVAATLLAGRRTAGDL